MTKLGELLDQLKCDWQSPRLISHYGETEPFKLELAMEFSEPYDEGDLGQRFSSLPKDISDFWECNESARLFLDVEYGQWGLELLSPFDAIEATGWYLNTYHGVLLPSDLVIGKFIGDSDILIVRNDPILEDFGSILVGELIDEREDWPIVANTFTEFLQLYVEYDGQKYWDLERRGLTTRIV